ARDTVVDESGCEWRGSTTARCRRLGDDRIAIRRNKFVHHSRGAPGARRLRGLSGASSVTAVQCARCTVLHTFRSVEIVRARLLREGQPAGLFGPMLFPRRSYVQQFAFSLKPVFPVVPGFGATLLKELVRAPGDIVLRGRLFREWAIRPITVC